MKKCSKCGEEKERSEFYVKQIKHNGNHRYDDKCKNCRKRMVSQRDAKKHGREYRTRAEWREYVAANRKPKVKVVREQSPPRNEWERCLSLAVTRLNSRNKSRQKSDCEWYRKLNAIASSVRKRYHGVKSEQSPFSSSQMDGSPNWGAVLQDAKKSWKARASGRRRMKDKWILKLTSMTRNWNRKAFGR